MKAFLCPWVLPVCQPPLADAAVVVDDDGRIVFCGPRTNMPTCEVVQELPRQAILPGLINAHTHLEFSGLQQPLGQPGMEFTRWISEVVAFRRRQQPNGKLKISAIDSGIQESAAHGVAAIGEIATSPVEALHYRNNRGCLITVFQEALGADDTTYDSKVLELENKIDGFGKLGDNEILAAISPHAPYSVPPALLERLMVVSEQTGANVAMHVAETLEEREFVEHRSGPFLDMLKQFGVWRPEMFPAGDSMMNILQTLSRAQRSLVIHGNYLSGEELDFIASMKQRMSIVFCPRTHRYFQHQTYPIDEIIKRGINLAVGTDSRSSNPDLDLMAELKDIRQRFAELSPETILKMGTINGAIALGIADRLGTLQRGKAGRMRFAELIDASDPYSWLR